MTDQVQSWRTYEEAARAVLHDLRTHFGITDVSGYADLPGNSGTSWEVEGTAIRAEDGGVLIMECRRHTKQGLSQEAIGGLAFRVTDTNSSGAIVVSPLPLQKGAALIAKAQNIWHVKLEPWSTAENYLAKFMGTHFHRVTERLAMGFSEKLTIRVTRDGKVIDEGS